MKITFLGTGTSQGIPVIGSKHPVCLSNDPRDKRLRVSVLLSWDDYNFVIDCGPDFRQQMLRHEISKLDGILFTHEHSDHVMGLDDIRPFFFRQGSIPIYAHERVIRSLRQRFDYILDENNYPGVPSVTVHQIENNHCFMIGDRMAIPIEGHHDRLQVFGFRINDFTYLTDMKTIREEEIEKILGTRVLVLNTLRNEPHHSHFNLDEALALIERVKPKTAYLTHISHLLGFHEETEKKLPKDVHLAYDNLAITL